MTDADRLAKDMRAAFEAELPMRVHRASRVRLQPFIPAHWFSTAGTECISMYISGHFYGAIAVAQAYMEALSQFLSEQNYIRLARDISERWHRLCQEGCMSEGARDAALSILMDRNDFHHLNKTIDQEFRELEARAEICVNDLYTVESEVFAYTINDPGKVAPKNPEYWPNAPSGQTQVNLRQLW